MSDQTLVNKTPATLNTKVHIDFGTWTQDGRDYAIQIIVDEDKLTDLIGKAIGRHDLTTKLAGGAITVEAKRIAEADGGEAAA